MSDVMGFYHWILGSNHVVRFGSSFSKTQIDPMQLILNYMLHSYCNNTNISIENIEKKKNEIYFKKKYTITTLHTKLSNYSK